MDDDINRQQLFESRKHLLNEIRKEAYFLWQEAGCPEGRNIEFWCEAERNVAGITIDQFKAGADLGKFDLLERLIPVRNENEWIDLVNKL